VLPERHGNFRAVRVVAAATAMLLSVAGCSPGDAEKRCSAELPATAQPGFALSMSNGECIGWTVEQEYAFSPDPHPEVRDLVGAIVRKNVEIARSGLPYVRVAVMMPLAGDTAAAVTPSGIIDALRGVYTAQMRANDPDVHTLGTTRLGVQVVLVNDGRAADQWQGPVAQLANMANGDHPLVAVTGLGASVDATQLAATELSRSGMPAVGAVVTGTKLTAPTLFHVAPSNQQSVAALRTWVDLRRPASGYLMRDGTSDPFLDSLNDALTADFGAQFQLASHTSEFTGSRDPRNATPNLFLQAAREIRCVEKSDVVFFSGRSRDLPDLVHALAGVTNCRDEPVTVAAVAIGPDQLDPDGPLAKEMAAANVGVVVASATNNRGWGEGSAAPAGYRDFHDYYRETLGFPEDALVDGYAIMHHDAVLTAVWAVRQLFEESEGDVGSVRPQNVKNRIASLHGMWSVPAASGQLSFGDVTSTGGRPHGKPVPLIEVTVPAGATPPPVYETP